MLRKKRSWLTDVVVFSARSELKAQGEGSEELELLWKLERSIGWVWPVALPTFEALGSVVTRAVAIIVNHVENIALRPLLRHWVLVVRTVDIQIVVYAHVNVVVPTMKPGCKTETRQGEKLTFWYLNEVLRQKSLLCPWKSGILWTLKHCSIDAAADSLRHKNWFGTLVDITEV